MTRLLLKEHLLAYLIYLHHCFILRLLVIEYTNGGYLYHVVAFAVLFAISVTNNRRKRERCYG